MIVLGIETSCDETACGIVEIDENQQCTLLANSVFSSMDLHKAYGGVVPEIAARSHIESIIPVIEKALQEAFSTEKTKSEAISQISNVKPSDLWDRIDAIAVTNGAGLGGSLLVGVMTARTLAITKNKPLYAINHVEAHVYANFITKSVTSCESLQGEKLHLEATRDSKPATRDSYQTWQLGDQTYQLPEKQPEFPMLALIVSGGHSQLALFRDHFDYTLLGQTRDDAIGEAFDKVAKIIGLPYPGGPSVAKTAKKGDPYKYQFPKSRLEGVNKELTDLREKHQLTNPKSKTNSKLEILNESKVTNLSPLTHHHSSSFAKQNYDFSFSGLKTAVLRLAQEEIGEDFTFPSYKVAERLTEAQKNDIAASFQRVAIETVVDKTVSAIKEFSPKSVVIAGGVAANKELRRQLTDRLESLISKSEVQNDKQIKNPKSENQPPSTIPQSPSSNHHPLTPTYTDIKLCTDNGAMVATLGCFKMLQQQTIADPYLLQIEPNLSM